MSFVSNVSITFITRIAIVAMSLVSSIAIARILGPSGKGAFAILGVIAGTAIQITQLGLGSANVHFAAKDPADAPKLNSIALWISFIGGGGIALVLLAVAAFAPHLLAGQIPSVLLLLTIAAIPFLLANQFLQNILVGGQAIRAFNLLLLANQAAITAGTLIILFSAGGLFELVILTSIITVIAAGFFTLISIKKYGLSSFDFSLFKRMIHYGIKIYLDQLFYFLILRSDLYLLNQFKGIADAGIYSIAAQYADIIFLVSATIALLLLPKMSQERPDRIALSNSVVRVTALILLLICVASFFIFEPLALLLFGPDFSGAVTPLRILLPGVLLLGIQTVMSMYIAGTQIPWSMPIGWMSVAALNIVLNIILIPEYGAWGAALSSTIAYGTIFLVVWRIYYKRTHARFSDLFMVRSSDIKSILKTIWPKKQGD